MVSGTEAEGNDGGDGDGDDSDDVCLDCDAGIAAQFIYVLQPQQQPKRIAQALPNLISCRLRKKNQNRDASRERDREREGESETEGGRASEENSAFRVAWPNDLLSFSLHLAVFFFCAASF